MCPRPAQSDICTNTACAFGSMSGGWHHVPKLWTSKTWHRIGVDLIVDSDFNVWLIELNHKSGMGAPSGRKGDMLHSLLRTFFDAERALRSWRNDVEGRDAAAACLGMTGEHAFGFVRLFVPSWVSSEASLPSS